MNCWSVSPFFHSSLHSRLTHSLISARTSAGNLGWSNTMFWKFVARWISIASHAGKAPKASAGRVDAPCCTAPPRPYVARASRDSACSASRSSCTFAIEPSVVALHERLQLVHVRILAALLADLGSHRHRHPLRLPVTDEPSQLRRPFVIHTLLLIERLLGQVHERRGVDVDVVEAGVQLFFDQRAHRLELGLGARGIYLRIHLYVVPLDKEGAHEALAQRRRDHHRDALRRPLIGVADLAAGDFADQRTDVETPRRPEHGPGGVVRQQAHVHGRRGERGHLPPTARQVQLVDRRGAPPRLLPNLPEEPARLFPLGPPLSLPSPSPRSEHRPSHQIVHRGALAHGGILEPPQCRFVSARHETALLASNLDRSHAHHQPVVPRRDSHAKAWARHSTVLQHTTL